MGIALLFTFIFIYCGMAGGRRTPEGKNEPSRTCTAIDLEKRIRMVRKHKGAQSLSAIACGYMSVRGTNPIYT
jgi:hypothetical protein